MKRRVSEARAVGQSTRMIAGGLPLPSVLGSRYHVRFAIAPGKCSVAPTPRSVQTAPPRGPPTLPPLRSQCHLVCPSAPPSAVVLLTKHVPAQHAVSVRRTATGRPTRHLGRLPHRGEGAGDDRGILDQPEELHPPMAEAADQARLAVEYSRPEKELKDPEDGPAARTRQDEGRRVEEAPWVPHRLLLQPTSCLVPYAGERDLVNCGGSASLDGEPHAQACEFQGTPAFQERIPAQVAEGGRCTPRAASSYSTPAR